MRRVATTGAAAVIAMLAIGAGVWVLGSTRSHSSAQPSVPAAGESMTNARIEITGDGKQAYAVRVACAPLSAPGVFETGACRAIATDPGSFVGDTVPPGCWGGGWIIELHITGEIGGRRVNIRQQGKCGPASTYRWRHLLYRYRAALDLPGWVIQGLI